LEALTIIVPTLVVFAGAVLVLSVTRSRRTTVGKGMTGYPPAIGVVSQARSTPTAEANGCTAVDAPAGKEAPAAPGPDSQSSHSVSAPRLVVRFGAFDFRIRLAFKFLQRGLWEEAAGQFMEAAELSRDRASQLKVQVALGNTFKRMQRYGEAVAAYERALACTVGDLLHQHLRLAIAELEERERTGQAPG
jgi:hypothetical protein